MQIKKIIDDHREKTPQMQGSFGKYYSSQYLWW